MAGSLTVNEEAIGSVSYAEEVVATIAALAATEIEGVHLLVGGFDGKNKEKTKKSLVKGVRVQFAEREAVIDIYLVVKYGYHLKELAEKVQGNIKHNLETMAGLVTAEINVNISGVYMSKDDDKKAVQIRMADESEGTAHSIPVKTRKVKSQK